MSRELKEGDVVLVEAIVDNPPVDADGYPRLLWTHDSPHIYARRDLDALVEAARKVDRTYVDGDGSKELAHAVGELRAAHRAPVGKWCWPNDPSAEPWCRARESAWRTEAALAAEREAHERLKVSMVCLREGLSETERVLSLAKIDTARERTARLAAEAEQEEWRTAYGRAVKNQDEARALLERSLYQLESYAVSINNIEHSKNLVQILDDIRTYLKFKD
jgi:hypothetical protein